MSNQRGSSSGKGWNPAQGSITTSPSVGRFENETPTTTFYSKGSSAKFTDNDGRKSIAPYSNYGQLSQESSSRQQQQQQQQQLQQLQQQQSSSGIVGLRTAPNTDYKGAKLRGDYDQQPQLCPLLASPCYHIRNY